MEVKPVHILGASIFAFFAIVAANVVTQYRSNADFRDKLKNLDPAKLASIRTQRVAEENMIASEEDEITEGA